jgi:peptidoglycan/LPS O-acetylase OafA/YrhL
MQPAERSHYRADIDGLRALAVLAVIAFHLAPDWLPGGFAGVDAFFVISGYLITRLITGALEQRRWRLADFYQHRIMRLLPAYALVSAATLAAASYLLIPDDYVFYTTSLAASWAFVSNIFFSMLSWGYFGQRAEQFPLLHTWSLSVEEQFYFAYPLLLMLLHRHWQRYLTPLLALLMLLTLLCSHWQAGQVGSYFLLPYRAHELLTGALVARALERHTPGPRQAGAAALAGLLLLAGSLLLLRRELTFPGLYSLPPCLGAALLLYGGARANPVSAMLARPPLVAIGLMSYSLYLWHWPILSLLRYRNIALDGSTVPAVLALIFALSYLSWRYVEVPLRRRRLSLRASALRYYAAPAAACLAVGLYSYASDGAPQRFTADARELLASYSYERDLGGACALRSGVAANITAAYLRRQCGFGAPAEAGVRPAVLLYGDSHAHHFKPFVEHLARQAGWRAVYHIAGSCEPFDLAEAGAAATVCQRRNADMLVLARQYRYVVLAGRWQYRGQEALFARRLQQVAQALAGDDTTLVLFKDNPSTDTDLSRCVLFRRRGWLPASSDCDFRYADVLAAQGSMDQEIDRLQAAMPQVRVINAKRVMCDQQRCLTAIGNTALYKDGNHLNAPAARLLAQRYLTVAHNPLAPEPAPQASERRQADARTHRP